MTHKQVTLSTCAAMGTPGKKKKGALLQSL